MELVDLETVLQDISLHDPALIDYVNGGNYNDRNQCYKFIALVKWNDGFSCRKEDKKGVVCGAIDYEEITPEMLEVEKSYQKQLPYSRRCTACQEVESPTQNTRLHGLSNLNAIFNLADFILTQNKGKRLSDNDLIILMNQKELSLKEKRALIEKEKDHKLNIYEHSQNSISNLCETYQLRLKQLDEILLNFDRIINGQAEKTQLFLEIYNWQTSMPNENSLPLKDYIKDHRSTISLFISLYLREPNFNKSATPIGDSALKEYRFMLQQYIGDWSFGKASSYNPFGIEYLWLKYGNTRKIILIARQMCENGQIRTGIYDALSPKIVEHFIHSLLPDKVEVILYGFSDEYEVYFKEVERLKFNVNYIDFNIHPFHVNQVTEVVRKWFSRNMDCLASTLETMSSIKIDENDKLQLHINEGVFVNFYPGLTTAILLMLLIRYPSPEYKKRKDSHTGFLDASYVAGSAKLHNT